MAPKKISELLAEWKTRLHDVRDSGFLFPEVASSKDTIIRISQLEICVKELEEIINHEQNYTHYVPDAGPPYVAACGEKNPTHINDSWDAKVIRPVDCPACLRNKLDQLLEENKKLNRLADEYTNKFMPAYTKTKAAAQEISRRSDLPQEMQDALRKFLKS